MARWHSFWNGKLNEMKKQNAWRKWNYRICNKIKLNVSILLRILHIVQRSGCVFFNLKFSLFVSGSVIEYRLKFDLALHCAVHTSALERHQAIKHVCDNRSYSYKCRLMNYTFNCEKWKALDSNLNCRRDKSGEHKKKN